jgi:hypothetical protein
VIIVQRKISTFSFISAREQEQELKGKSRKDNPKTLATFGTQDTGQGQKKQKKNKKTHTQRNTEK